MEDKLLFRRIFIAIRIIMYILIIYTMYNLIENSIRIVCNWNEKFGLICPTCGATRATISIIKGNFTGALKYNLIYSIAIFPLGIALIIDDIVILLLRLFRITKKRTLIEVIFEVEGDD